MRRLPLPVAVEDWPLGSVRMSLDDLIARFGPFERPQGELFGYAGPVLAWGIELEDGQCVLLLLHGADDVQVFAEPKDLERALEGLGIGADRITLRVPPRSRSR